MDCTEKHAAYGLVFLAYTLLEFWLGKTKRVRAASLVELIFTGLILWALYWHRRNHGSKGH